MKLGEIKVKVNIEDVLFNKKDELKEFKAKQKGDLTPKELIIVLLNELVNDNIEELVVIRKLKNGDISSGWTVGEIVPLLGMAELIKTHALTEYLDQ